jgi:hypothetical protein
MIIYHNHNYYYSCRKSADEITNAKENEDSS